MNIKNFYQSFLIGAFFAAIITIGIFWNNLNEVNGAPLPLPGGSVAVTGEAWSDNIGWIQFNPSYGGVFYDISTGQLSGYAWSDNIGWITFDGLSADQQSSVGGSGAKAKVKKMKNLAGHFSGWARACAGTQSGDCSSMDSRTDGWDGWIKFNTGMADSVTIDLDSTHTTGTSIYGDFHGYAWGSDVVGWVSFNCAEGSSTLTSVCSASNYKVTIGLPSSSSSSSSSSASSSNSSSSSSSSISSSSSSSSSFRSKSHPTIIEF